uniref:NADH-ubiquinone oxidoreductase chain 1 n=2 Tax=Leishmania guyanensis species complex TaxID=38579 RepID=A0A5H3CTG5_LEIPA|nr:TPA_asm: NADH dehyrogenase 1 [Leishmania panamensis]DAC80465.1 TPA_asm: NADH dehyrogenase 1 [Leishmania shawi]
MPSLLLNLDIIIIIIIIIIVILVLTGFVSLCERRILALVQIRIGPSLFLFGLFTPITDGIKLFLKFIIFVISFEILYLIGAILITACCIFLSWFYLPIGFIILLDSGFTLTILMCVHIISNMFSIFFVGCFLFSSCFVYLSAMRTMFFCIISESGIFLLYTTIYSLDYFSFFGIKDICIGQLYIMNFYITSIIFISLFWISMLLDGLKLPFDYMECESELVAGLITELSGFFFIIYSVIEINHVLIATLLFSSLCFGGLFICIKSLIILVFGFFYPRVIGYRLKITTAQAFILIFLFYMCALIFTWLFLTKIITLLY